MMGLSGTAITGIDTHAHLFHRGLPVVSGRRYTLDYDATEAAYLGHLAEAGLSHGVLVQPSFLGTDNSYMLDVTRRHPGRIHAIAAVDPGISEIELDRMAADGCVGIRLNLIGLPLEDYRAEPWAGLFRKLARRNWVVEIHRRAGDLPQIVPQLLEYGLRVAIDHYGRPDPALCADDPGFLGLLDLAQTGGVWVKVSAPYRSSDSREATLKMSAMLREAFGPGRLLWGSDWPHTQYEAVATYADEYAALEDRIPDAAERLQVMVETPAKLYGFV